MDNDPRQNIPGEKGDHHNGTWVGIYTVIKGLTAMRETRVQSLGWEYSLEKELSTHSCILAWRSPWTEEPDGLTDRGVTKSWTQLND